MVLGMGMSRTYQLVDLHLKGHLEQFLRDGRSEGLSFDSLALGLKDATGVPINGETVRGWCHSLDIDGKQRAS